MKLVHTKKYFTLNYYKIYETKQSSEKYKYVLNINSKNVFKWMQPPGYSFLMQ